MSSFVADRYRLPGTLAHSFFDLFLVLRCHFVLQDMQVILVVEIEHLGDDAHAHPVPFTESEVHFDLLTHARSRAASRWVTPTPLRAHGGIRRRSACARAAGRRSPARS